MKFYMPVTIYDEAECVLNHAAEWAVLGSKALIVTGRSSAARNGSLADVKQTLSSQGRQFCVFSDVEENPSVETVVLAAEYGLSEKADFVIGVGGGSPMDAAKAVAFLMDRDVPSASYLYDGNVPDTYLPVICVPTTCGTGSEVTGVSVLTRHDTKTKKSIPHRIYPDYALIDGKYLEAAPFSVIVNTAVDALAHLIESYLSVKADDYSRYAALAGLDAWQSVKGVLTGNEPLTDGSRARLMRASALAGIAIAQTGTALPHALGYIITYDTGLAHGPACGLFLSGFLAEAGAEDREKILRAAGFWEMSDFDAFMKQLLPAEDVPDETAARTFEAVLGAPDKMSCCCFPTDEALLRRVAASAGLSV